MGSVRGGTNRESWEMLGLSLLLLGSLVLYTEAGVGQRRSHHAAEPDLSTGHKFRDPSLGNSVNRDDVKHEAGEVKVGKKWEFPVAQPKSGRVWGTVEESRGGKRILAFRGIKHLQPPTGERRFKPPVPTESWGEEIKDAKHNGHICPQHLATKRDTWVGDEDCLWLNVFTRDLVAAKKRPVIVWIHGGNFGRGSAAEYNPDYLLDEDIVLVTLQYRLGMFGFLSTESADASGNYGLLDQIAGLKWVQANIEAFSGDPGRVTIMGQQAGGASVHYLLLSPLTRGLFSRAVSMSGTALSWWASLKRPLEKAQKLGKLVECENLNNATLLVECLREQKMEDLMNNHPNFYNWQHLEQCQEPLNAWSPRVDPEAGLSVMPQEPIDVMRAGSFQPIPWVVGITDDEGADRAHSLFSNMKAVKEYEEDFDKIGPLMFGLTDGQSEAPKIMAKRVKDFYWADSELGHDNVQELVNAISDSSYAFPVDAASKEMMMKSGENVYVYHFTYRGEHSVTHLKPDTFPPQIEKSDLYTGVANGDDLMYLFPIYHGLFRPLNGEDLKFSQRLIELYTTFAAEAKPKIFMGDKVDSFEWAPSNPQNITHLNIGRAMDNEQGLPNHRRVSFWQALPVYWNSARENYAPAPPPSTLPLQHGGEL